MHISLPLSKQRLDAKCKGGGERAAIVERVLSPISLSVRSSEQTTSSAAAATSRAALEVLPRVLRRASGLGDHRASR